jgi:hypothetical protein
MNIELLYFKGCPSWKNALRNLKNALEIEAIQAEVDLLEVKGNQEASRLKFLGSPSFRVDGQDLWPETRHAYRLNCRVYPTPRGMKGMPSVEMLREKLRAYLS